MAAIEWRRGSSVVAAAPVPGTTERDLIVRAQRYEADAVSDLFDAHLAELHAYVDAFYGDPVRTEEMVRLTLLRALQGLPRFRRYETGFGPWLFRVANAVIAERNRGSALLGPEATPGGSPEQAELREAVRRLTPDQLDVLGLRFIAGLNVPTVAKATGRRLGQVQALQHRALLGLKRVRGQEPVEVETA